VLFFGNNWVAAQLAGWLRTGRDEIVGVVAHPPEKSRFRDEILSASGIDARYVFDGSRLEEPGILSAIRGVRPEIGLCVYFGYVLKRGLLDALPAGCINVHPALLPYNRGAYPNVWSIVEGTPAGVTIHYIDEGIDTGDIISQREVPIEPVDTGASLYRKLEIDCVQLFKEMWPSIAEGRATRRPQPDGGTSHRLADVRRIDQIDLDRTYRARELINIIRGRTFPPHRGAYFRDGGRTILMRLELQYDDESHVREAGN
jgi:methionyl-tRNA formyltransferase